MRRVAGVAAWIVLGAAVLAGLFAEPRTLAEIGAGFLVVVAGPLNQGWTLVRSTGPVRRTALLLGFVVLPIVAVALGTAGAGRWSRPLRVVGVVAWWLSGLLMLSLRYVD